MKIILSVLLCTSLAIWTHAASIDRSISRCIDCVHENENCSLCIPVCHSGIGSECLKCAIEETNCLKMCSMSCYPVVLGYQDREGEYGPYVKDMEGRLRAIEGERRGEEEEEYLRTRQGMHVATCISES